MRGIINMLYKVDLYNSVNGKIVNDSDKVDYIIVEKRNNKSIF